MLLCEIVELLHEVSAGLLDMRKKLLPLNGINNRQRYGARQRTAAKGGSVHARSQGSRGFLRAKHRSHRQTTGKGLGQRRYVGLNAIVLVRAPLSGPSHAALDLVRQQQCAGGIAQLPRGSEELLRQTMNSALALERLYADRADLVREGGAKRVDVIEGNKHDARHNRFERFTVLCLVRGGNRSHRASMEAVFESDDSRPDGFAFTAQQVCMCARQLESRFPRLRSAVAEEDAVHAGNLRELHREMGSAFVEEEIGRMQQLGRLFRDGARDRRMRIAKR